MGCDLVPGTGRDMLTAEERGGVVRFLGRRSHGMLGKVKGGGWMKQRMEVEEGAD